MGTTPGVDYAWSHPGGAALQKAGKRFACRYLSNDPAKSLGRAEADDLAAHGLSSVVVWETTAKRPLAGRPAGISDAQAAARQAANAGMPASRPVYFAVEFDATASQLAGPVAAYFAGAASVLGAARVGGYGGYDTVRYLLDHGLIRWAWQTRAWSEGRWDSRAHIRQGATQTIGGVSCDLNTAMTPDFGQWMPGRTPDLEDDMPLTDADVKKIRDAVAATPLVSPTSGQTHSLGTFVRYQDQHYAAVMQRLAGMNAAITTLAGLVGKGVDTAQVVAAVQAAIKDAVVHVDVDITGNTAP